MNMPAKFKMGSSKQSEPTNVLLPSLEAKNKKKLIGRVKLYSGLFITGVAVNALLTYAGVKTVNSFFDKHYLDFHPVVEWKFNPVFTVENRVQPTPPAPVIIYDGETLTRNPDNSVKAPQPKTDRQKFVYELITLMWGEDANTGHWLARCESGYGTNMVNGESTASGVFQFLDGTWTSERTAMKADADLKWKMDTAENIRTGYSHFKRRGLAPWEASRGCWGVMEQK